ncbi:MAG TPA: hypothetical protein DEB74_14080, partial [Lachnospiraceae bacterium]|nr:hypothetical protein [Lachnospiraceae bacterium]
MNKDVLELDNSINIIETNEQLFMLPNASKWDKWKANFKKKGWILLFIIPALLYIILFCYVPMYGILVAFQDYIPGDSIIGSDTKWVGFENFHTFFANPNFGNY